MQYVMRNSSVSPCQKESLLIKPPMKHRLFGLFVSFVFSDQSDLTEPNVLHLTWTGERNQDGGVEGCALTPSCKNTRITTSCWTIINRKTLELTKNIPHIQRQRRNHNETVGGAQSE